MERKILFKAKRLDNGKWVKGSLVNSPLGTQIVRWEDSIEYIDYVDPSTVCQLTGMHDKKGTPIWEGDIVKDTWSGFDDNYEIVYVPDEGAFAFKNLDVENDIQPYSNVVEFVSLGSKFDRKEGEK